MPTCMKRENLIFINVMHKINYLLGKVKCQIESNITM